MRQGKHRRNHGFALVSIIILGAVAVAMMMALFPLILNIVRTEGSGRTMNELRNAAEIGIDYGIKQLNDYALVPVGEVWSGDFKEKMVPPAYLVGFPDGTVKIRTRRLSDSDWDNLRKYSTIYSPYLDKKNAGTDYTQRRFDDPVKTIIVSDHWIVLESTAKKGAFSKSIRVYLEPRFDIPPGETSSGLTGTPNTSYFQNNFFGNSGIDVAPTGALNILGSEGIDNGNFKLSLQSNKSVNLNGNATILGNVQVSNGKIGAVANVATGTEGTINGRLLTNGGVDSYFHDSPNLLKPDLANDNVLAWAEQPANRSNDNLTPINSDAHTNESPQAPAQTNSSAAQFPALSGNTPLSGSYSTSSLNLTDSAGTGTINSDPVKIFIKDGASSFDAVDIKSSAFNATDPQSLQIWYNGNRAINIDLDANFNGVIYAPNAPITLKGSKDFTGSLVGDTVTMNNSGTVKVRTDYSNTATPGVKENGLAFIANPQGEPTITGYKAITWLELNREIVP
jgi:hypothetical protein